MCFYLSYVLTSKSHFNLGRISFKFWHKKMYCPDAGEKRGEAVKSECDRQFSELEVRSTAMVYQKDGSSCPIIMRRTIDQEANEGVPEMVTSCIIEFADNLLRVAKHGDQ